MFIEALLLGAIVGLIRKGRVSNLSEMQIRGWVLVVIGALIQFAPILLNKFDLLPEYHVFFPFAALVIMIGVALMNLEKSGLWMILAGGVLNGVAIALNGFKMPVDLAGLKYAGLDAVAETIVDGSVINYVDANTVDNFSSFLGKIVAVPSLYPFAKVLSVGDILMMVGIVLFISGQMTNNYFRRHGQQLRYSYKSKY
ncbi:MAG: DUF5317 domain-containing protein [Clostridia bacterium]|nr:DUF5317 domain-containing protein [Clostridia bacterium]